jgi:hypothetical protein
MVGGRREKIKWKNGKKEGILLTRTDKGVIRE